ncbi:MAG: hypothetical protein BWX87_00668 [Bacteroidetes bacterium ADurb.Bin123]|jgi:hypothetical protein|nr:MAG: hypothetical protein BWX87_00668 [Bacteroidetes bacterium ADurb.Bin123]
MKKLLLFVIIPFIGCSPKYMIQSVGIDFTKYTTRGFTISTTTINQIFEPVGLVEAFCIEGISPDKPKPKSFSDPIYTAPQRGSDFVSCTTQDILEVLYNEAVKMGANGIVNLQFYLWDINNRDVFIAKGEAVKIQ